VLLVALLLTVIGVAARYVLPGEPHPDRRYRPVRVGRAPEPSQQRDGMRATGALDATRPVSR
jgi:hypothetical protein